MSTMIMDIVIKAISSRVCRKIIHRLAAGAGRDGGGAAGDNLKQFPIFNGSNL